MVRVFSPLFRLKREEFVWNPEHQRVFDEIKNYLVNPPILSPPVRNRCMSLYNYAFHLTIGSMLSQEDDNGVERDIYYLSRVLNDVETRYSLIKKMCLCLYFSCMKLKHYIKPVDVYVSSHFNISRHMLSKPMLYSRIGKLAISLTKYSLTCVPLKVMKGKVVVDFIMDHAKVETPLNYLEKKPWKLYFDGSSHKNETGVGILIVSPNKIPTKVKYQIEVPCSNNEVEYEADLGVKRVEIRGDYELVMKQITKEYKCIKENIIMYFVIVNQLIKCFNFVDIQHVPILENQEANELAQVALGYKVSK